MYETEAEQLQRLKDLWKAYGIPVVTGIVLGGLVLMGWRYWLSYQNEVRATASQYFEQMQHSADQNPVDVDEAAAILIDNFSKTPYAELAELKLAQKAMQAQKYDEASGHLKQLIAHTTDKLLIQMATGRLALVLMSEQKWDEALTLLDSTPHEDYVAVFEWLKGDILVAKQDFKGAKAAYDKAFAALLPENGLKQLLQIKIDDLGDLS